MIVINSEPSFQQGKDLWHLDLSCDQYYIMMIYRVSNMFDMYYLGNSEPSFQQGEDLWHVGSIV